MSVAEKKSYPANTYWIKHMELIKWNPCAEEFDRWCDEMILAIDDAVKKKDRQITVNLRRDAIAKKVVEGSSQHIK